MGTGDPLMPKSEGHFKNESQNSSGSNSRGCRFCVARGGWACVHPGRTVGREAAALKAGPAWLLEGQRDGLSTGRAPSPWPRAAARDTPGEAPAATGEAPASFHRPEVNDR